jgi:hypothetical protein
MLIPKWWVPGARAALNYQGLKLRPALAGLQPGVAGAAAFDCAGIRFPP